MRAYCFYFSLSDSSLSKMTSGFSHVVADSVFPSLLRPNSVCVYISYFFIYPLIDMGCFHALTIVNNGVINMAV